MAMSGTNLFTSCSTEAAAPSAAPATPKRTAPDSLRNCRSLDARLSFALLTFSVALAAFADACSASLPKSLTAFSDFLKADVISFPA